MMKKMLALLLALMLLLGMATAENADEQTVVVNSIMTARKLVDMVSNDGFMNWQKWWREDGIYTISRLRYADTSRPAEVWICPDVMGNNWAMAKICASESLTAPMDKEGYFTLLLCFVPDAVLCVEVAAGKDASYYWAYAPEKTKDELLTEWENKAYQWDVNQLPDTLTWIRSESTFGDTAEETLRNHIENDENGDMLNGRERLLQVKLNPEQCESMVIPPEFADEGIQISWLRDPAGYVMNQLEISDPEEEKTPQELATNITLHVEQWGETWGVTTEADGWGMTVLIPEAGDPYQMLWMAKDGKLKAHVVWMPSEQLRACETNEDLAALLNAQVPGIVLE